jgi:hypothetical protein
VTPQASKGVTPQLMSVKYTLHSPNYSAVANVKELVPHVCLGMSQLSFTAGLPAVPSRACNLMMRSSNRRVTTTVGTLGELPMGEFLMLLMI